MHENPELAASTKRPDFLAKSQDGVSSVFECTVATEESKKSRAAKARLHLLIDAINERVHSRDFYLCLRIRGATNSPVPVRNWARQVQQWLDTLDRDLVLSSGVERPEIDIAHDGLAITFSPIVKTNGDWGRTVGMQSYEGGFLTTDAVIRDTVRDKAMKYGELGMPFVVVVNCLGDFADAHEIHDAMFGHAGLWRSQHSPAHTRVSAVLAIRHLLPWSIAKTEVAIYHNPNAKYRYQGPLTCFHQRDYAGNCEGVNMHELLQVSALWPFDN